MLTLQYGKAITTVGYGEITPRSTLGRLVTIPLLAFGLLLIALPSFVLGREFSIVWNRMTRHDQTDEDQHPSFDLDPTLGTSLGIRSERDLSNRKLAQNQTELSRQISELRSMAEAQGEMIRHLMGTLEGRAGHGIDGVMGVGTGAEKERVERGIKGKAKEMESPNGYASASWVSGRNSLS
ncbi:hypothetical protein JVT61DRAFT_11297 [Boletus reticuloceps]|uniref:Potassium channel domain-containing protein n=1 Tax=Boletus reticuloceps TaxID=495285 RepID=A0A8I3A465_9AGAM|nr:hypothetical protein JVT61DRAFT_11297 [Boletus reticuloceps]